MLRQGLLQLALALVLAVAGGCRLLLGMWRAPSQVTDAGQSETTSVESELLEGVSISGTNDGLLAPYGTKVLSISDRGTEIYWKRVEGAAGYEVARAYEADAEPEHLAFVAKASFTYTDSSFDHDRGQVWYFIRGLSDEGDSYAAGPWSEPLEAHFVDHIQVSPGLWYLPHGESCQFEASYGWGSVPDAQWSSADEHIASIDANGLLLARAAGTVEVSCTSEQLGQSQSATVTVDRPEQTMLHEASPRYVQQADGSWHNPSATDSRDAVLVMAGDLMCMGPQLTTHYDKQAGYDFDESYDYVKPVFESADLAVGNLETMIASAYPYSGEVGYVNGKPICNAPARYLDALRYGGLDVLCMANNHNADVGPRGVAMTLEQVERYGFAHTGLFANADEDRTLLVDVGGIKVGFVAYVDKTCGFNGQDDSWSSDDRDVLLNAYDPERAAADIAHLRERGAEYVIGYLHWGSKNYYQPVEGQQQSAQELADLGMDYIVGSHPHLVQRFELIEASDGRSVPCIYSVGDFNSYINQVEGNLDSVLVRIRLHRTKKGRVILAENAYIPCHIYKSYAGKSYVTIPLVDALNGAIRPKGAKVARARIAEQVGEVLPCYQP